MNVTSMTAISPTVLKESLATLLEKQGLHETEHGHLTRALADYCPCPAFPAGILRAAEVLRSLKPQECPLSDDALTTLIDYWSNLHDHHASEALSHVGTLYPVLYGLARLDQRFGNATSGVRAVVSAVFLKLICCSEDQGTLFSGDTYYSDVLSIRDALIGKIAGIALSYTTEITTEGLQHALLSQVAQAHARLTDTCDAEPNASTQKIRRLHALLTSDRVLGCPAHTRSSPSPRTFTPLMEDRDISPIPDDGGDWQRVTVALTRGNETADDDDLPSKTVLQRRPGPRGSRTTAGDDLRNHRTVLEATESANTPSLTDLSRLPLLVVRQFFAQLVESSGLLFAACWIVVTTGLKASRLVTLLCEEADRDASFTGVHLDSRRGVLSFEVEGDAADRSTECMQPTLVVLVLPREINALIAETKHAHPFQYIEQRVDDESYIFKMTHPGLRPTLANLARSYRTLFAPLLRTVCLQATLPGQIRPDFRAQAAYYATTNTALNVAYTRATKAFAKRILDSANCTPRLTKTLANLTFPTLETPGGLGSRDVIPTSALVIALSQIVVKATELQKQISSLPFLDTLPKRVELFNLQSANRYIMQSLDHGFRPIAEVAHLDPANPVYGAWAKDKNSSMYAERRLTAFSETLSEQCKHCQVMTDGLAREAERKGIRYQMADEAARRNLALYAELRHLRNGTTPTLHVRTLTAADYKALMEHHQIAFDLPDNFNRKWLAQQAEGIVRQAVLDQTLGHTRGGHDVLSPYSSASLVNSEGGRALDQLVRVCLDHLPFRIIKTEV